MINFFKQKVTQEPEKTGVYKNMKSLFIDFLTLYGVPTAINTALGTRYINITKSDYDTIHISYAEDEKFKNKVFQLAVYKDFISIWYSKIPADNIYLALCEVNQILQDEFNRIHKQSEILNNLLKGGFN